MAAAILQSSSQAPVGPAFGLWVSRVRVRTFRALTDVTVSLDRRMTVLVGENNSGKTSFLDALSTALGRRRARVEDLQKNAAGYAKAFTVDLRIEPVAHEFPEVATQLFGDAIQDVATDRPYVALRARGELDERADIRLARVYLKDWDAASQLTQPRPSDRALDLLLFEALDARRDILEQLRNRSSLLGRALSGGAFEPTLRADAESRLREVAELLRTRVQSLSQLRIHLRALRSTLPSSVTNIEVDPIPQELEDLVRAVDIRVEDAGCSFPAGAQGMGTRALAALLVFRTFIDVARANTPDASGSASLAAFEEPEAHLHPQAQRAVVRAIREMPGQIVISSHSGEVAGQVDVPELRVFRRSAGSVLVKQASGGPDPASEDGVRRRRILLGRNAAALFARGVIVVEGETEGAMLPVLADAWWAAEGGAFRLGVEFVVTDGAGSARHIVPALEAWGVPWWLVVDGDAAGQAALAAVSTALGRPVDAAHEAAVLMPNLEEYLLSVPGYREIVFQVGQEWPDEPIEEWRQRLNGQRKRGNIVRDYETAGWEDRLALDWLTGHKGTVGAPLARAIVSTLEADGNPRLPPIFRDLLVGIDARFAS